MLSYRWPWTLSNITLCSEDYYTKVACVVPCQCTLRTQVMGLHRDIRRSENKFSRNGQYHNNTWHYDRDYRSRVSGKGSKKSALCQNAKDAALRVVPAWPAETWSCPSVLEVNAWSCIGLCLAQKVAIDIRHLQYTIWNP